MTIAFSTTEKSRSTQLLEFSALGVKYFFNATNVHIPALSKFNRFEKISLTDCEILSAGVRIRRNRSKMTLAAQRNAVYNIWFVWLYLICFEGKPIFNILDPSP